LSAENLSPEKAGATSAEQEEAINVALVVGGSIVIPHLRRAYELLGKLHRLAVKLLNTTT
jgi:ribonuclease HI